jgi:hypothetical protein
MRTFLTQTVPSYAFAFLPAVLVRMGWAWMAWTALDDCFRIGSRVSSGDK